MSKAEEQAAAAQERMAAAEQELCQELWAKSKDLETFKQMCEDLQAINNKVREQKAASEELAARAEEEVQRLRCTEEQLRSALQEERRLAEEKQTLAMESEQETRNQLKENEDIMRAALQAKEQEVATLMASRSTLNSELTQLRERLAHIAECKAAQQRQAEAEYTKLSAVAVSSVPLVLDIQAAEEEQARGDAGK